MSAEFKIARPRAWGPLGPPLVVDFAGNGEAVS